MKAWLRVSPPGDIRVFAATSDTTDPVREKEEPRKRLGSIRADLLMV